MFLVSDMFGKYGSGKNKVYTINLSHVLLRLAHFTFTPIEDMPRWSQQGHICCTFPKPFLPLEKENNNQYLYKDSFILTF